MADGSEFFYAEKGNRNAAFSFPNQVEGDFDRVISGDQAAHVHPFPRVIPATEQKVGMGDTEPAPQAPAEVMNSAREDDGDEY